MRKPRRGVCGPPPVAKQGVRRLWPAVQRIAMVDRRLIRRAAHRLSGQPDDGQAGGRRFAEGQAKPVEEQTPGRKSPGEARVRERVNSPLSDHGQACGAKPRGGRVRRPDVISRTGGRAFKPPGRFGSAGMQFHRRLEKPLKGQAQERSRYETGPARLGREQSVVRVTKPWGRNRAGR